MNIENEIYKRENLPQDQWSRIDREAGKRRDYNKEREEYLKRQETIDKMVKSQAEWEERQREDLDCFYEG